jgi:hypothetical protein
MARFRALHFAVVVGTIGCAHPPPPSAFPTARDALDRLHATQACSRGVGGETKIDYFGEAGRVRGSALFILSRPELLRLDVFSPFGVTLSTLTTNERDFALLDVGAKRYVHGPARACNVRHFLRVPIPPHALASLMTGEAPVLVHRPEQATIEWTRGRYVVSIESKHAARQTIDLAPHPADYHRPWQEQRVRVERVRVSQRGVSLYDVQLAEHAPARTARPREDPDGIDPDVPPSGPTCEAELPRRFRFVSDVAESDVIFALKEVEHNPPLIAGLFEQSPPPGVVTSYSVCSE